MYRSGSEAGESEARACDLIVRMPGASRGRQKDGDSTGVVTRMRAIWPGTQYSGCPGSRSRMTTPPLLGLLAWACVPVSRRFVKILPKVDLPDDFGPVIMTEEGAELFEATSFAASRFHSGGAFKSCRIALLGPSSDV